MKLQHSRAGRTRVSFPYRVPRDAKRGSQVLTVRGVSSGDGLEALEDFFVELLTGGGGGGGGPTRSIPDLANRIAALGVPNGVRATFARKDEGPVVYSSKRLLIRGKTQIPMIVRRAAKKD
jgi:hypothetical protein